MTASFGRNDLAALGAELGLSCQISEETFPTLWTPVATVQGVVDGVAIAVQRFPRKYGWDDRAHAATWPPLDLGLHVFAEGTLGRRMRDLFGATDIQTGDDELDRRVRVQGDEPERVVALLGEDVRRSLLSLASAADQVEWTDLGVRCSTSRSRRIDWRTAIPDLARMLRGARRAAHAVPTATPLVPWAGALSRVAASYGLRTWPTPLSAEGRIGALDAGVFFRRVEKGRHAIEIAAVVDRSMAFRLSVEPRVPRIPAPALALPEPIARAAVVSTMDDPFDRVFEVTALGATAEGLARLLPPAARRRMVELTPRFDVFLRDGMLGLRCPLEATDPTALPALVDAAADAARSIVPALVAGYRARP